MVMADELKKAYRSQGHQEGVKALVELINI